jgi:hypothetical protein
MLYGTQERLQATAYSQNRDQEGSGTFSGNAASLKPVACSL